MDGRVVCRKDREMLLETFGPVISNHGYRGSGDGSGGGGSVGGEGGGSGGGGGNNNTSPR